MAAPPNRLWTGRFDSYATVQKYQTLANADGYKGDQPYSLLPRLSSQWQKRFGIVNFQMFGQYSNFRHDSKQEGSRLVLNPSVSAEFNRSWGYVRPKLGLHATYYNLDSHNGAQARNFSRILPPSVWIAAWCLSRPASLAGA